MRTLLNFTRMALCAGLGVLAAPAAAEPLALTKSFEGNLNFAGTQASLQSKSSGAKVCDLTSSAQAGITLPTGSSVVSATLYWAGTGAIDTEVSLNGSAVTAPAERRYSSSIDGLTYFAGAADVTALVQGKTSFTFAGLSVSTADIYCSNKQKENAIVAGFALAVVYSHASERYRTVNVYEGLQAVKNTSLTVQMPDYTPPAVNTGSGRFAYIVWEGDKTGQQKGDYVTFADQVVHYSPYVQKDNAFNSKSSANFDENSGGIDFDVFDLPGPPASTGDAKAVFTTANDRVLLGTAIVALPSKPADLSIKKTQAGEFKLGNEITYTLAVSNEGARADANVVVRDTLSGLLTYVSASGTDWTCTLAERTVTCKYNKPLAPGAGASVQIKAKITTDGKVTNTAEVSGTADGVPGNNKSTVEGDTGGLPVSRDAYVFTTGPCLANAVIKPSGEGCARFTGPVLAGSKPTIYITSAQSGVAKAPSTTGATNVNVVFSLECNNPTTTAGTDASYAGKPLGDCVANDTPAGSAGAAATLQFAANEVSKPYEFHYPDVGRVTLRMRDAVGNVIASSFSSLPSSLKAAYRRGDGVLNPGSSALTEAGFAEAGEPFQVVVSAYGVDGNTVMQNFGRESGEFALAGKLEVLVDGDDLETRLLESQSEWNVSAGTLSRGFVWNEAGTARLKTSLNGYLGSSVTLATDFVTVGRFYPAYFRTETDGGFGCLKRMGCPADAPQLVTRASFSKQSFDAIVRAYGRNGQVLQKFKDALVPAITLTAVSMPGETGKELDKFSKGADPAAATERQVAYRLATGYDAKAGTRNWTVPTAVHVRASAPELRKTAAGAEPHTISSLRAGTPSVEGGMMVINGRLMVGNTLGTPLAKTPVPLRAQYWSGSAWEANSLAEQTEPVMGTVEFSECRRSLRLNTAANGACDMSVVMVAGTKSGTEQVALPMLKDGKANLILAPVGDRTGNVDLFINGEEYLPSTFGRVSFGQFKSPVIYVREMY
ncbi:DUF6701 domain-containing protein [Massilia sp. LjRoot122]|uniref:DUF6701 domain-containing protein n=1 Tax=Massilia sp. LjRoot122 TaxID=3342257 RepID=UPI003ECE0155